MALELVNNNLEALLSLSPIHQEDSRHASLGLERQFATYSKEDKLLC